MVQIAAHKHSFMSIQKDQIGELSESLGEAIAEMPEYKRFVRARRAVEADQAVQSQISTFEQKRTAFMQARNAGNATKDSLEELQQAQQELHSMPKMNDYLTAQDELQQRLETVNRQISAPLEIDFGAESGGCCQD
jgi:cell fate (sporulation/competence/biofilm development) regulator YlbF (YheA/YmcA/DUF963 family)